MRRQGVAMMVAAALVGGMTVPVCAAEREPMTMRVVAVNPSAEKAKTVPVRIDLPQEIKPGDIIDHGDLEVEFDTERSLYFVHKEDVTLSPKQTRIFEVVVKDVWFIPDTDLAGLRNHAQILMKRLEKSEYRDAALQLGGTIVSRLDDIQKMQDDESVARKQRIGAYRRNLLALQTIKEDLARLEKLLSFAGGPPVPQMLEESPLKSDAPSTTTTWLVIFLIVIFMGLLAGQFFFTWQRRLKTVSGFSNEPEAFPNEGPPEDGGAAPRGGPER
ncbi:MAG: hypothetical protein HY737_08825 [Candidatus Omnitrophica bacterium]|nr:hypothetical protein [Candidatus Omnitrophota bacterium]